MASYEQLLASIYVAKPAHWPRQIRGVEEHLGLGGELLGDEAFDVADAHRLLFAGDLRNRFADDVQRLRELLRKGDLHAAQPVLDALQFVQSIIVTAMWKYGVAVGDELEAFARDYDRLDTEQDRQRLYQEVVSKSG